MGLERPRYKEREEGLAAVHAAHPGEDSILNRPDIVPIVGAGDLKYAVPLIRVGGSAMIDRCFHAWRGTNLRRPFQ